MMVRSKEETWRIRFWPAQNMEPIETSIFGDSASQCWQQWEAMFGKSWQYFAVQAYRDDS